MSSSRPDTMSEREAQTTDQREDIHSEASAAIRSRQSAVVASDRVNGSVQDESFSFGSDLTLENIRHLQAEFSRERGWDQFHTPRNLLLAMVGEVGEVSELFQWRGEVAVGLPDWSVSERGALSEELADVLIYLVRLSERCHVDLPAAVMHKLALNRLKYPVERVYGSSKKYCEYSAATSSGSGPVTSEHGSRSGGERREGEQ